MKPGAPGRSRQAAPVHLELRASPVLRAAIVLLTLLAAIAIELSQLPRLLWLALPPALAFAFWRLAQGLPLTLVLLADGRACKVGAHGHEDAVQVLDWQERGPLWLLRLQHARKVWTVCGAGERLKPEQRRAVRLWWARHGASAASGRASP